MATTANLISGKNIAPGTSYTRGVQNILHDSAVVTEFISDGVNSKGKFKSEADGGGDSRETFAIDGPPLEKVSVIGLPGGSAIRVQRYGRSHGWKHSTLSVGSFSFERYEVPAPNSSTRKILNLASDPRDPTKKVIVSTFVPVSTIEIRWTYTRIGESKDLYDVKLISIIDTTNSNSYTIDKRKFSKGTLRFRGFDVDHQVHGGKDIYTGTWHASFSREGWYREVLEPSKQPGIKNPTVKKQDIFPSANWPSMP